MSAMNGALTDARRKGGITQSAALMRGPMKAQYFRVCGAIDTMAAWNKQHAEEYAARAQAAYSFTCTLILGMLTLSLLIGIGVAALITRYMTGTLSQVTERISSLNTICIHNLVAAQ